MFMGSGVADEYVAAGRLNYLGVGSKIRMDKLPNVPAISELGFPEFELVSWYGVAAPAKTPDAIIARWSDAIAKSLADPATRERVASTGAEPLFLGGADFSRKFARRLQSIQSSAAVWECGSDRLAHDVEAGQVRDADFA
jgi:tripartite-type tricarboxylate transporter receptor subunit TctC